MAEDHISYNDTTLDGYYGITPYIHITLHGYYGISPYNDITLNGYYGIRPYNDTTLNGYYDISPSNGFTLNGYHMAEDHITDITLKGCLGHNTMQGYYPKLVLKHKAIY